MAEEKLHEGVRENDIIMVYSDGYGDNVHRKNYEDCLTKYLDTDTKRITNLSRVADC